MEQQISKPNNLAVQTSSSGAFPTPVSHVSCCKTYPAALLLNFHLYKSRTFASCKDRLLWLNLRYRLFSLKVWRTSHPAFHSSSGWLVCGRHQTPNWCLLASLKCMPWLTVLYCPILAFCFTVAVPIWSLHVAWLDNPNSSVTRQPNRNNNRFSCSGNWCWPAYHLVQQGLAWDRPNILHKPVMLD